jgi:hypothetical protein
MWCDCVVIRYRARGCARLFNTFFADDDDDDDDGESATLLPAVETPHDDDDTHDDVHADGEHSDAQSSAAARDATLTDAPSVSIQVSVNSCVTYVQGHCLRVIQAKLAALSAVQIRWQYIALRVLDRARDQLRVRMAMASAFALTHRTGAHVVSSTRCE